MAKRKKSTGYRVAVFGAKGMVSILLLVLAVILLFFLGRMAYRFGYSIFHEEAMEAAPGENITVVIPEHAEVKEIAQILENAGLIEDAMLFRVQERLSSYHETLAKDSYAGGTFRLNTSQTPTEILAVLAGDAEGKQEET